MMNREYIIAQVLPGLGRLNALVKNIMRQIGTDDPEEAIRLVNSGEWIISKPVCNWREEDGVIYLTFISNGFTGPEWIEYFESNGFDLNDSTKSALCSDDFKPTEKGTKIEAALLKGMLFKEDDRLTKNICAEADRRGWMKPNAELSCLIRMMFTDKEIEKMGLWAIVGMHEPIKDSNGVPVLLTAIRSPDGRRLYAFDGPLGYRWACDDGFVFAAPQVRLQG